MHRSTALALLLVAAALAAAPDAAAQGSGPQLTIDAMSPLVAIEPGDTLDIPFTVTQHFPVGSLCTDAAPVRLEAKTPHGEAQTTPDAFAVDPWIGGMHTARSYSGTLHVSSSPDTPAFTPYFVTLRASGGGCDVPSQTSVGYAQQDIIVRVGYQGVFSYDSTTEAVPVANGTLFRWTIEARHVGNGPGVVDFDVVGSETTARVFNSGGRVVLDAASSDGEPAVRTFTLDLVPAADQETKAVLELSGRYAGPMPYEPDVARINVSLPPALPPDLDDASVTSGTVAPTDDARIPAPGLLLAALAISGPAIVRRRT